VLFSYARSEKERLARDAGVPSEVL